MDAQQRRQIIARRLGERAAPLSAAALAREKGWRALRLDVLEDNVPAQRLYQRAGFVYIETKQIWYESTGLANFLLYEYAV